MSADERNPPPAFTVVQRWVDFALLAAVIGALAVVGLVLRPARRYATNAALAASRRAEARLLALAATCGAGAFALGVLALPTRALELLAWEPGSAPELLGRTRWGELWLGREALLAGAVVAILVVRRALRRRASTWALPLAGAFAATAIVARALDGHAVGVTSDTALSVATLALHMLAAALWVGGLFALAVGFWPVLRRGERADTLALLGTAWAPFGRLAAASVGALVVTGLYTAGRQAASIDAIVTTLYGQVLAAKTALLPVVGGLGLLGALTVHPQLARRISRRRFPQLRTLLVGELSAGLLVLLAAALMSSTEPARGPDVETATRVPSTLTGGGGDLLVTLSASPNRPGENVFSVVVASTRRPDPPPPSGVELRFPARGTGMPMREVAPGHYQLAGDQLSADGQARVEVVVRRREEPGRTVGFSWRTAPAPRAVVISDRPLAPMLTMAAALLALAGAVAAISALLGRTGRPRAELRPVLLVQADSRKDPS